MGGLGDGESFERRSRLMGSFDHAVALDQYRLFLSLHGLISKLYVGSKASGHTCFASVLHQQLA